MKEAYEDAQAFLDAFPREAKAETKSESKTETKQQQPEMKVYASNCVLFSRGSSATWGQPNKRPHFEEMIDRTREWFA
jgi:hypothetical protein